VVGGFAYLAQIAENTPSVSNIQTYAKHVRELSVATLPTIFIARAVLPIEGRPAIMIKSPFCKPEVFLSNSVKPVSVSCPCNV
jgi:hypothetical protein